MPPHTCGFTASVFGDLRDIGGVPRFPRCRIEFDTPIRDYLSWVDTPESIGEKFEEGYKVGELVRDCVRVAEQRFMRQCRRRPPSSGRLLRLFKTLVERQHAGEWPETPLGINDMADRFETLLREHRLQRATTAEAADAWDDHPLTPAEHHVILTEASASQWSTTVHAAIPSVDDLMAAADANFMLDHLQQKLDSLANRLESDPVLTIMLDAPVGF